MRKLFSITSIIRLDGHNSLVLFCIIYTVGMMCESILGSIVGAPINIQFFIWSSVFYGSPILSSVIFNQIRKAYPTTEKVFSFCFGIPIHYLATCGLIMFFTFIQSFFIKIPHWFYLIRFIYSTVFYAIILIGSIVIDLRQTGIANENLKKIQASQSEQKGKDICG